MSRCSAFFSSHFGSPSAPTIDGNGPQASPTTSFLTGVYSSFTAAAATTSTCSAPLKRSRRRFVVSRVVRSLYACVRNVTAAVQLYFLLENGFLDSQTRALFVDTSSYNPALNIFAVVRILFEFTPAGDAQHLQRTNAPPFACQCDVILSRRHCFAVVQCAPPQAEPVRYYQ